MSLLAIAFVVLTSIIVQVNGQICADYGITVTQETYVEHDNVVLTCTYTNDPTITNIDWQFRNTSVDNFALAYSYFKDFPEYTKPSNDFEGRLNGEFEGKTHTLTILNSNSSDDLNIWRCIVNTAQCIDLNYASLSLSLYGAEIYSFFMSAGDRNLTGELNDGANLNNEPNLKSTKTVNVSCYSLSDPKSQLTIEGVTPGAPQTCHRLQGPPPQPYNCSVWGSISIRAKGSRNVYCQARFNDTYSFCTDKEFRITIAWLWWEILLLILGIVLAVAIVWGITRCCIGRFCLKSCDDKCLRMCCLANNTL